LDEHALLHRCDGAGLQVEELEWPERDADQAVDGQPEVVQHGAHLAILALAQADDQPGVARLLALEHCLDRTIAHAAERDAVFELVEGRLRYAAVGAHAITPEPASCRQLEMTREATVVAEQQQALGIDVKAADGDDAR